MSLDQTSALAFVVPRYGADVVGGAETLLRRFAEELTAQGHTVQVLTTCTDNMNTWNNHHPPGPTVVNGVPVLRFPVDASNMEAYHEVCGLATHTAVSYADQQVFIQNSINSQALYRHLEAHRDEYRAVIFGPYLFGTTYWGAKLVPGKAIIVPCLHEEPFAHFTIFHEMLEEAAGIVFNTEVEQVLTVDELGLRNPRHAVVGYGLTPSVGDGAAFRAAHNLKGDLLLYAGRLDDAKNVPLLLDFWSRYQAERQAAITLVLTGVGPVAIPARPDVVAVGMLPTAQLPDAFAAATLLCQPSVRESFSIVIMEAWLQGRPVLVHRDCAVTYEHVARSGGGLAFASYDEFRAALDQVFVERREVAAMGERGQAYVAAHYTWEAVLERFNTALGEFLRPRSLYEQMQQAALRHALNFSLERYHDRLGDIVARAEQERSNDAVVATPHELLTHLRAGGVVGNPGYQPSSRLPVVGRWVSALRRQLTSHLREPYLDPIIARQEQYNQRVVDALLQVFEQQNHAQARLMRRLRALESQVAALQRTTPPTDSSSQDTKV